MNIASAILRLYPTAKTGTDFMVRNDGQGQYIDHWSFTPTQPTTEELRQGWLVEIKEEKITLLNAFCEKEILDGFTVQETGNAYGFSVYDQMNMTQQYILFLTDSLLAGEDWKTENNGTIWHSREDFELVINRASQHKWSKIKRYWSLKEQVNACVTEDEVSAIQW